MTDADPTMVRPVEVVARALCNVSSPQPFDAKLDGWDVLCDWAEAERVGKAKGNWSTGERARFLVMATAVLNRLHELGAFNDQFYDAIRAEERK